MGDIKIISKEYGSKSEAAYKILNKTHEIIIPHILYLAQFLRVGEETTFRVVYDKYFYSNNGPVTINDPEELKERVRTRLHLDVNINFKEKTFKIRGQNFNNEEDANLSEFKNHVSEHCADKEKIAICDGIIKYAELLQEELWEIEVMDDKIDIFKKTMAKREVIVEKSESKE